MIMFAIVFLLCFIINFIFVAAWKLQPALNFILHLILYPLCILGPVLLYVIHIRKEKLGAFGITTKNIFTATLAALLVCFVVYIIVSILYVVLLPLELGIKLLRVDILVNPFRYTTLQFIAMAFTFFIIVAPVEELVFRGYFQTRAGSITRVPYAILIASVLFGLIHIPKGVVSGLPIEYIILPLGFTIPMGILLGYFFLKSGNIIAPIICHGAWNWTISYVMIYPTFERIHIGLHGIYAYLISYFVALTVGIVLIYYLSKYLKWEPGIQLISPPIDGRLLRYFKAERKHPAWITTGCLYAVFLILVCIGIPYTIGVEEFRGITHYWRATYEELTRIEATWNISGYSEENTETIEYIDLSYDILRYVECKLIWMDEPDAGLLFTNQPDTFQLIVTSPSGESKMSEPTAHGEIELVFTISEYTASAYAGIWELTIICGDCGDQTSRLGLRVKEDRGNSWELTVLYAYYIKD
jgi:membrane protease YdiL (CAAX protease family)